MQKTLLILSNLSNVFIVLVGVSFMAKIASDTQFEDFTISSLVVGFIGTVEGIRSVIISNIKKVNTNFLLSISIYSAKIVIIPIIIFVVMFYFKFGVQFSLIFLFSTLLYFVAVINLSLLEGKGFVGFGALSRTVSWALFYFSSIVFIMLDISLDWTIFVFSISFFITCVIFTKVRVVLAKELGDETYAVQYKQIRDSYVTNVFRIFVDYLDRLVVLYLPNGIDVAAYFSRLELAQKIVNLPQLIAIYIYPKMCVINDYEVRNKYFILIFLLSYIPIFFLCLFIGFNYVTIIDLYFHGRVSEYDYLFVVFISAFMFNVCSFFFVPHLRSYGDFETAKLSFMINAVLFVFFLFLGFTLKFFGIYEIETANLLSFSFLLSKISHSINFYRSFYTVYGCKYKSIIFALLIVFLNLSILVPL